MSELHERLVKLDEVLKIQATDGNWNYNAYMHGMMNGLALAWAIMHDDEPPFRTAPEVWLEDKPRPEIPEVVVP